jgi:hypothetical protein
VEFQPAPVNTRAGCFFFEAAEMITRRSSALTRLNKKSAGKGYHPAGRGFDPNRRPTAARFFPKIFLPRTVNNRQETALLGRNRD